MRISDWSSDVCSSDLSGPHLEPFACTTEDNGLGAATDEDCSAPTVVRWSYVDGAGELGALDDPANPPADVETTEIAGREVPMIVRTESGTITQIGRASGRERGCQYV